MSSRDRWLVALVLVLLAGSALLAFSSATYPAFFPLVRNYNEGWNAYWQSSAVAGRPLYAVPPTLTWNNYPPLGFYIVGALGRLIGDPIAAGRVMSALSVLSASAFAGAIAARLAASYLAGWVSALVSVLAFGAYFPNYVGMNDPQFLAHALMMSAAWVCVGRPATGARVAMTIFLMAIAGLVKHNLLAFPAAYTIFILLYEPRQRAALLVAGFVAATLSLAVPVFLFGDGYLAQLMASRQYSLAGGMISFFRYLEPLLPLILLAATWGLYAWRTQTGARIAALYLGIALCAGAAFAGGSGIWYNIAFDSVLAAAILAGPALVTLGREIAASPSGFMRWASLSMAVAYLALSAAHSLLYLVHAASGKTAARYEALIASSDVAFLAARPGRVACYTLALCQRAGKAFEIDFLNSWQAVVTGRLPYEMIEAPFVAHAFDVVQLIPGFPQVDEPTDRMFQQTLRRAGYVRFRTSMVGQYWRPANDASGMTIGSSMPNTGPLEADRR